MHSLLHYEWPLPVGGFWRVWLQHYVCNPPKVGTGLDLVVWSAFSQASAIITNIKQIHKYDETKVKLYKHHNLTFQCVNPLFKVSVSRSESAYPYAKTSWKMLEVISVVRIRIRMDRKQRTTYGHHLKQGQGIKRYFSDDFLHNFKIVLTSLFN